MKEAKIIITNIVKGAYDNDIISKPEYSAMLPPEEEDPVPEDFIEHLKYTKIMNMDKHLQLGA